MQRAVLRAIVQEGSLHMCTQSMPSYVHAKHIARSSLRTLHTIDRYMITPISITLRTKPNVDDARKYQNSDQFPKHYVMNVLSVWLLVLLCLWNVLFVSTNL